jgi:Ca2+-binding RTX toxin-like protein
LEGWYRGTASAETLTGSSFNDTFFGAAGADTINTSTGSDTFVWRSGDGNDFINEESSSTTEVDVLRFTNVNASGILLSHVGNDLMVDILATGERIEVDEHFWSTTQNYGVERFEFADGTVWDHAKINSEAWYRGTAGVDTMSGSNFNDTLYGAGGNDIFNTSTGSDTFVYASGDGNDYINEGTGSTSDIDAMALTGSFYMLQVYDRVLTSHSVPTLVALSVRWQSASISSSARST